MRKNGLLKFLVFTAVVLAFTACPVDPDNGGKEQPVVYTVSFNVNGGSGTTPSAQTGASGSTITLPQGSGLSRNGYEFGGWNTAADGSGTNYAAGASYTITGTVTLYAKWNLPDKYKDFYNYPDGRKSPTGTLEIKNSINTPVLLFTNDVKGDNYIGTLGSLNDAIKVTLPEQKFYTIVAVEKASYEENQAQAMRFSEMTYYSRTQPFSVTVHPSSMFGGGQWIINNSSNYWVSFNKQDGSGEIFAAAPPRSGRVIVPIQMNVSYDYIPHFYRELKYNGVIIALAESDDLTQSNTVFVTSQNPSFTTDIGTNASNSPSASIKPAVFATNSSSGQAAQSYRVYFGQNNQLSSLGITDFVLTSGNTAMFSGLNEDTNVNQINFQSLAAGRLYVKQDMVMKKSKVYKITITGTNASDYDTTVIEVDAEDFYQ